MISIEEVHNGFIVSLPDRKKVFANLENVMAELLAHFEGRAAHLDGDMYGVVFIQRERYVALQCEHVPGVQISVVERAPLDILF